MKPQRIQRQRTKGWRMPENTVYVGRGSSWGNPFVIGKDGTAEKCIQKYVKQLMPYTHQPPTNTMHDFYQSEATLTQIQLYLRGQKPCLLVQAGSAMPCGLAVGVG